MSPSAPQLSCPYLPPDRRPRCQPLARPPAATGRARPIELAATTGPPRSDRAPLRPEPPPRAAVTPAARPGHRTRSRRRPVLRPHQRRSSRGGPGPRAYRPVPTRRRTNRPRRPHRPAIPAPIKKARPWPPARAPRRSLRPRPSIAPECKPCLVHTIAPSQPYRSPKNLRTRADLRARIRKTGSENTT